MIVFDYFEQKKSQLYAYTVGSFGDLVRKFVSVKRTFYPNVFCMSAFSQTHFATLIRYFNVKSGKFSK